MPGPRHDPATTRVWARAGTARLTALVEGLPDDALARASLLPGWTRAHVVAHVARNADALARLVQWARTGVETPMYASREARDTEIERSAALPPDRLRRDLATSAEGLEAAFAALDPSAWSATVVAGQGREVRAGMLPWLRTREVWLHAADLDADAGPAAALADAPAGLLPELLTDVTRTLTRAGGCPVVDLVATDLDGGTGGGDRWSLGEGPREDAARVAGPAPALALWVSGRGRPTDLRVEGDRPLPELPRWL